MEKVFLLEVGRNYETPDIRLAFSRPEFARERLAMLYPELKPIFEEPKCLHFSSDEKWGSIKEFEVDKS